MDHRIEKLAEMMVGYSCEIKPGEHIMIRYGGEETLPLVASLVRHIYAAGAFPYLVRRDRRLERSNRETTRRGRRLLQASLL